MMAILFALLITGMSLAIVFARLWRRELLRGSALKDNLAALHGETARLARELEASKAECLKLEECIKSASSLSEVERCQYEDKLRGKQKAMQEKIETLDSIREIEDDLLDEERQLREREHDEYEMSCEYVKAMLGPEHKGMFDNDKSED